MSCNALREMKAEFVWICFEFWLDVPIWISKLQWTRLRFCSLKMFEILNLDWTLTSWKLLWYSFCRSLYFRVETSNMLVLGGTHPPLRKFDSYTFEKSSGQWSLKPDLIRENWRRNTHHLRTGPCSIAMLEITRGYMNDTTIGSR